MVCGQCNPSSATIRSGIEPTIAATTTTTGGMRKYAPSILLCLLYVLGEAHLLFPDDVNNKQNWILTRRAPMTVAWNVKYAASQLQWIVAALMVITYRPNKVNRTSMVVFLLWGIFDTFAYFYNYKTVGYFAMYAWLPVAWILIYYWKSKQSQWLWQQLTK